MLKILERDTVKKGKKMKILIILFLISNIYANIDIHQNIRALYKGVELSEMQEDYILDYQDDNIEKLQKSLKKEIRNLKSKYLNEKNIVTFELSPNGEVSKIKFLKFSNNRKLDRTTKKAIQKTKFIKPNETTIMRYIISYNIGRSKRYSNYEMANQRGNSNHYQNIQRGTTNFNYQSAEYVRVFETSKDGFINLNTNPQQCMKKITLLKENGQTMNVYAPSILGMNKEASQGKYKLLFQTKKDCKVNLQYP